MKILIYFPILVFTITLSSGMVNAQDHSAIIDFESADQGILIPQTDTTFINAAHTCQRTPDLSEF
jgi:hypothetical protein